MIDGYLTLKVSVVMTAEGVLNTLSHIYATIEVHLSKRTDGHAREINRTQSASSRFRGFPRRR